MGPCAQAGTCTGSHYLPISCPLGGAEYMYPLRNTLPLGLAMQVQDWGKVGEAKCKEAWLSGLCKCRTDPAGVASSHLSP